MKVVSSKAYNTSADSGEASVVDRSDAIFHLERIAKNLDPDNATHLLRAAEELKEYRAENESLSRQIVETMNEVIKAHQTVCTNQKPREFSRSVKRAIDMAAPEERAAVILAKMRQAMGEMMVSPAASSDGQKAGPDPTMYDLRSLNQRRADAIVAWARDTGKKALKSIEVRAFLEALEHRELDRKTVWRAMRTAQGLLRASRDIVAGAVRLVMPDRASPESSMREDLGGNLPRRRGWAVPWDG